MKMVNTDWGKNQAKKTVNLLQPFHEDLVVGMMSAIYAGAESQQAAHVMM